VSNTRRVAERLILERADRARRIGAELRAIAERLEAGPVAAGSLDALKTDAASLRSIADQVEKL
jgi:hypothetical protein